LAAAFYAVAFLIFAILMFSWTVIGPMFHQPIHSLAAKEAAMLPLVSPIIFVVMWLFSTHSPRSFATSTTRWQKSLAV